MPGILLTEHQKGRVASLLRQHGLLFGGGLVAYDPAVDGETDELLASLDSLDDEKAARIASILQQHVVLFGEGMVLDRQDAREEDLRLIRALRAVEEPEVASPLRDIAEVIKAEDVGEWRPRTFELKPAVTTRVPPPVPTPVEPEPRPYPLQGPAHPRRIAETAGLAVVMLRSPAVRGQATLVVVPFASIARKDLEQEPVELWLRGEVHIVLLEPWRDIPFIHPEWPRVLGAPPAEDALLRIATDSKDRICLGMRPLLVPEARSLTLSEDDGVSAWVFPAYGERHPGLVPFLARTFQSALRIGSSDADGTAYFAVARIVGRV